MIYEITDTACAAALFDGWEETLIWSCLDKTMGKIYANDPFHPSAAAAVIADFAFFAGTPDRELAAWKPAWKEKKFMIFVPQNEKWHELITGLYQEKTKTVTRYAFQKEPDVFDLEKLKKAADSLPAKYEMHFINENLYHRCRKENWSRDLVSQFPDYESFQRLGIGVMICLEGKIVSGASSYTRYKNGIEIEIDTQKEFRQKGLAYACAAKLICECCERGLYPSWDAQNPISAGLAEKLGYKGRRGYEAVEVLLF